jgi:transposase
MASDLLADLRRLDDQLKVLDKQITAGVKASATSLPDLYGLGPVLAARILGRIGDITRFSSAGHLASYCGTAPIDVSSGDTVRHRLSRAGDARSATRCTSWPSLKLAATPRGAPTTCANAKPGKATTKRCAA